MERRGARLDDPFPAGLWEHRAGGRHALVDAPGKGAPHNEVAARFPLSPAFPFDRVVAVPVLQDLLFHGV